MVHNALYSRNYATFAQKAGINYTVYYTDYHGMTPQDKAPDRLVATGRAGQVVYNYRSSHGWREQAGVSDTAPASSEEQLLFHCMALLGQPCPTSSLSPQCQAQIREDCMHNASVDCTACVHSHAHDLIAAGCPKGPGAAQQCIEFCKSK